MLTASIVTLLSGCGDKKPASCDENSYVARYGGKYSFLVLNIDDSLIATNDVANDGKVQFKSTALNTIFDVVPNTDNCGRATISNITSDSLYINSETYVKDLQASGTGTVSGNNLNVTISIAKGTLKTTQSDLVTLGLNNKSLSGLLLTGAFTK